MCCIQMWEEELAARKAVRHEAEVRTAFEQLDTDSDGYITVAEVQHRLELDDDEDGEVRVKVVMGRGERVRVVRRGGMTCGISSHSGLSRGGSGLFGQ